MKNTIIAILVVVVLIFGFIIINNKKPAHTVEPWPETEPAHTNPVVTHTDPTPCAPSIVVSSPAAGAAYTVGQQVTIKWTTCGVQNIYLSLLNGGHDNGLLKEAKIPASSGTYVWTATNPAQGATQSNTNSYQIGIQQAESPSVMVKSGTFTVTTPETQSLSPHFLQVLVDEGKIDRILKFTYNGKVYYSATDNEVIALDGGSRIYNSSGVIVEGCGAMGPDEPAAICKTQNRSQIENIYTR